MIEVTDPKVIEFLGPGRHRYQCPKCNDIYDSIDPIARKDEKLVTLSGETSENNTAKSKPVIFEPIHDANRHLAANLKEESQTLLALLTLQTQTGQNMLFFYNYY